MCEVGRKTMELIQEGQSGCQPRDILLQRYRIVILLEE